MDDQEVGASVVAGGQRRSRSVVAERPALLRASTCCVCQHASGACAKCRRLSRTVSARSRRRRRRRDDGRAMDWRCSRHSHLLLIVLVSRCVAKVCSVVAERRRSLRWRTAFFSPRRRPTRCRHCRHRSSATNRCFATALRVALARAFRLAALQQRRRRIDQFAGSKRASALATQHARTRRCNTPPRRRRGKCHTTALSYCIGRALDWTREGRERRSGPRRQWSARAASHLATSR